MPPIVYYRYFSHPAELDQLRNERKVRSTNRATNFATWYTPTRYNDPTVAQQELALKRLPRQRVGPILADQMPELDFPPRVVAPLHGQPGGGIEVRTSGDVWLFGCWNFATSEWEF